MASVDELVQAQAVSPVRNLDEVYADFWPDEEPVEEFTQAVRQWRREELTKITESGS